MFKRVDETSGEFSMKTEEMKEVVYDASKHSVTKGGPPSFKVTDRFLDLGRADAEILAKALIDEGTLRKFRIVPIGMAVTEDSVPGRLTLTIDSSGRVVSADQE